MTVRDKLREINVRLVELANYLKVSRPTIYKHLENYEEKDFSKIDKITFDLFSYIDNEENLSKPALMNYLIQNIISTKELVKDTRLSSVMEEIRKLHQSPNAKDQEKFRLIESILIDSKNKSGNKKEI
ncbi:MAG TPA: hypothetical protein PLR26_04675 [Bacilli bacterium]|nr:hypothetical protein [Bacilli bacterium]